MLDSNELFTSDYKETVLKNGTEILHEFIDEDCLDQLPTLIRVVLLEEQHRLLIKAQKIQDTLDVLFPDEADLG